MIERLALCLKKPSVDVFTIFKLSLLCDLKKAMCQIIKEKKITRNRKAKAPPLDAANR